MWQRTLSHLQPFNSPPRPPTGGPAGDRCSSSSSLQGPAPARPRAHTARRGPTSCLWVVQRVEWGANLGHLQKEGAASRPTRIRGSESGKGALQTQKTPPRWVLPTLGWHGLSALPGHPRTSVFTVPHLRLRCEQSPILSWMPQGVGVVQVTHGEEVARNSTPLGVPVPAEIKVKELICLSLTAICLGFLPALWGLFWIQVQRGVRVRVSRRLRALPGHRWDYVLSGSAVSDSSQLHGL